MKTQMTDNELGLDLAKLLGGAAAGALLMYILDPDRGSARRAQSVAAVRHAGSRTSSALGNVWRGAGARIGAAADDTAASAADLAAAARPDGAAGAVKSSLSRLGQAAGEVLDETISKAKSVASRAGDAAGDMASKAGSAMSRAGDSAGDLASRVTGRANRAADAAGSGIDDARSGLRSTLRETDWRATARNPKSNPTHY